MKKRMKITVTTRESASETFERFLLTKRADGAKTKTIETYTQHFHAISKHLDINKDVAEMTSEDLKQMIVSMQERELSPNSIKSYTITLKAFLSWCNQEGITTLNMAKYKGEETIKETDGATSAEAFSLTSATQILRVERKGLSQKLLIKRMAQPFAMQLC